MNRIMLKGGDKNITIIPNSFVDKYMVKANGEYVKVYLYLRRCLSGTDREFTVGYLADVLEHTESDIIRALKYWEGQGLLKTGYRGREIETIELCDSEVLSETAVSDEDSAVFEEGIKTEMAEEQKDEKSPAPSDVQMNVEQLKKLMEDEDVKMLLYVVQKYLEKPLNSSDTNIILYIYTELGLSTELIEYLVEYCVSNNHKNIKYIEKVAVNWHESGVTTVEEAKELSASNNFYPVLKAFGLSGRNPATVEKAFIVKWKDEYGFDMDIIVDACNRTMDTIHQPSFQYADSILQRWKKKGVKSQADIKVIDDRHEKEQENKKAEKRTAVKKNTFNSYSQRTYDYDELERMLLQRK